MSATDPDGADEVARFEVVGPATPEASARVLAQLDAAADARTEADMARAASFLRRQRGRRRVPATWLVALLSAAVAAIVTWALVREPDLEQPAAFVPSSPPASAEPVEIRYDERGRIVSIAPASGDGEHLWFRSGRLIRVERRRDGKLHGQALDFAASGTIVGMTTWEAGSERGPFVELDANGRVLRSGDRP